jgi:translocator protein
MSGMKDRSARRHSAALLGFVAVCLTAGGVGSFATTPQIPTWYASLSRPPWTPPSWVFAPVWTTLYIMMGVSGWLVWRKSQSLHTRAFLFFWIQLGLNALWSFLFFGWESPGLAFGEIVLLWLSIAATFWMFRKWSGTAALLLVPYLGWVSFASYLNFAIWQLN